MAHTDTAPGQSVLGRWIRPITKAANAVGVSLLLVMAFLITADVFMRYAFNSPILGSLEITEFMLAVVVFMGLAYAQSQRAHVGVDLVVQKLPPRLAASVDSVVLLLAVFIYALIAWKTYGNAMQSLRTGLESDILGIPHFPFRMLVPFGSALLCLELLATLEEKLRFLWRR